MGWEAEHHGFDQSRSYWDMGCKNISSWGGTDACLFDGVLRYVDTLPAQHVGSYVTLDLRLAKQVTKSLELSVVGLNLAQDHHREFGGGTEVQRSIYGQVRWRW